MTTNLFIFGLGYSAMATVNAFRAARRRDVAIAGTIRDASRSLKLGYHDGVIPFRFDGTGPGTLAEPLDGATHVLQSIPPGEAGDPVLAHLRRQILDSRSISWLCYYSTVGVYGDAGGGWIDETTPPEPKNPRSQWRVGAEEAWRELAREKGVPLTILRLAGIYGPGRSTFDKLKAGTARRIVKPGQVFNRIHVQDIARVTMRAADQKLDGTFNLADDAPAPPQEVVAWAAEKLGVAPPPETDFDTAEMTPMARSFYADNKRVSNAAIKKALGTELLYPDYRAGLEAVLRG